jgi:isopentenyldiphosphate isomerase
VLDAQGRPTGTRKRRGDVHRDGDWHAALHVWVVTTAPGQPQVVLQRRSAGKDTWPGRLDVAVGGHVRAGETLAETLRECEEEIGLTVDAGTLAALGRRSVVSDGGGALDREHQEVYAVVVDRPLSSFALHPHEVDALVRLPLEDARALLVAGDAVDAVERTRDDTRERTVRLQGDDIVPGACDYYAAALDALGRLAAGETVEPFLVRSSVTR